MLGQGKKLDDVLREMGMVVEGVRTTKAAYELAKSQNIDMPITNGIYQLLYENKSAEEIAIYLMKRSRKSEIEGFASLLGNNKIKSHCCIPYIYYFDKYCKEGEA